MAYSEAERRANRKWYKKWYTTKGITYHKEYQARTETIKRISEYRSGEFYKIGVMLGNAKRRARLLGVEFSLSRQDIEIPDICPILGIEIKWGNGIGEKHSPSLDRVDCRIGYIRGNIRIISFRANYIKNDGSAEEHRAIADYMDSHLQQGA